MWWGCDRVHHVTPAELDWTACEDWRRKDSLQDKWRCLGIIPCVWSLMSHEAGAADYVNRLIKTVGNCTRILLLLLIEGVLLVWVPRKIFWLLHLLDTRITTLWLLASTCMAAQTHVLTRSFMTPIERLFQMKIPPDAAVHWRAWDGREVSLTLTFKHQSWTNSSLSLGHLWQKVYLGYHGPKNVMNGQKQTQTVWRVVSETVPFTVQVHQKQLSSPFPSHIITFFQCLCLNQLFLFSGSVLTTQVWKHWQHCPPERDAWRASLHSFIHLILLLITTILRY